jgi:hypothetical protein
VSAAEVVLLLAAVVPAIGAAAVYWFGFRWAKRHDREQK